MLLVFLPTSLLSGAYNHIEENITDLKLLQNAVTKGINLQTLSHMYLHAQNQEELRCFFTSRRTLIWQ